jgi:hypothetical protein
MLFVDAQFLPPDAIQKTHFFNDAASSILTALEPHIAVPLALELLLPHALHDGDRDAVSMMSTILEHYLPPTTAALEQVLGLCRPLVERKSVAILDGCASAILGRFLYVGDVHLLLDGIALEELVYEHRDHGTCYRTLVCTCWKRARQLLTCCVEQEDMSWDEVLAKNNNDIVDCYSDAKQMVEALLDESFAAAQFLTLVVAMCEKSQAADEIIMSLEWKIDAATGVQTSMAPACFHWSLLRIARRIMAAEENEQVQQTNDSVRNGVTAAFSTAGVTVLMDRLLMFTTLTSPDLMPPEQEVNGMKEALVLAIARAFVYENSLKKNLMAAKWQEPAVAKLKSVDLPNLSPDMQQALVDFMLDG